MKNCDVCGQRVEVVSSDEGTSFYRGLERELTLEEAAEVAGDTADHIRRLKDKTE